MVDDELDQRLWELEYELLTDSEAESLRARIAADPEVASQYTRVRERVALVARAARVEASRIQLRADGNGDAGAPVAPRPAVRLVGSALIRRAANWSLAVSAGLLIGLVGWSGWREVTSASRDLAVNDRRVAGAEPFAVGAEQQAPVWIVVNTPAQLSREAKNPITVATRGVDGAPQPTELDVRLDDAAGNQVLQEQLATDAQGNLSFELPDSKQLGGARLSVASAKDQKYQLQVDLSAAPTELVTRLATDRPRYRPGDVVRYRSVTLSRFGLKADQEVAVEYHVTDPAGVEISGSRLTGTTTRGVGSGELALPEGVAGGRYTLIARSSDGLFADAQRDFHVHDASPRKFDIAVEWSDPEFSAGKRAAGSMTVKSPAGEPAAGVPLKLRAYVDGRQVELPAAEVVTDGNGRAAVEIPLPDQIASRFGELGIQAGEQDAYWKDIPLQVDQVQVDFYPEGGELTAQVENRVYFHGHDGAGDPVAIRGRVVDTNNQMVCEVVAEHEGRGAFRFTPEVGQAYSLRIDDPSTILTRPALPAVNDESRLVLDCGPGVYRGDEPIQVGMRSKKPPAEFLVVAYCRGVLAGQVAGTADDFSNGECSLSVPVIAEAGGVLRVTVLDYSRSPPEPLAERLIFRRPARQLRMHWTGLQAEYETGGTVRGTVVTTDEADRPVSAVLGVSAIDTAVLDFSRRSEPRMATQFLLLGDVARPEQLEDANVYLSDDPAAARALDLLLGTQGWRRFERIPESQMAGGAGRTRDGLAYRTAGGFGGMPNDDRDMLNAEANGLGMFGDAAADAPSRFDNLGDLSRLASAPPAAKTFGRSVQPSAERSASRAPALAAGVLLLFVIASAVVRWRPTRIVLAMVSAAAISLVLIGVFVWSAGSGRPVVASGAGAEDAVGFSVPRAAPEPTMSAPAGAVEESREEPAASPKPAVDPAMSNPVPNPADQPLLQEKPSPKRAVVAAPKAAEPMPGAAGVAPLKIERRAKELESAPLQAGVEMQERRNEQPPATTEDRMEMMRRSGRLSSTPEVKKLIDSRESSRALRAQPPDALRSGASDRNRLMEQAVAPAPALAPAQADLASEDSTKLFFRRFAYQYSAADKRGGVTGDFPETVLWNPLLVTDQMGQAEVQFDVPDTVTRFRILVEGQVDGRLGESEQILSTRK